MCQCAAAAQIWPHRHQCKMDAMETCLHMLHYIKRGSNNCCILAETQGFGDRHRCVFQGCQHLKLTLHGMCRGQNLARWLLAQHVLGAVGLHATANVLPGRCYVQSGC